MITGDVCSLAPISTNHIFCPHAAAPVDAASLLFDPPDPQIIGETQRFLVFHHISPICTVFLLTAYFFLSLLRRKKLMLIIQRLLNYLQKLSLSTFLTFCKVCAYVVDRML